MNDIFIYIYIGIYIYRDRYIYIGIYIYIIHICRYIFTYIYIYTYIIHTSISWNGWMIPILVTSTWHGPRSPDLCQTLLRLCVEGEVVPELQLESLEPKLEAAKHGPIMRLGRWIKQLSSVQCIPLSFRLILGGFIRIPSSWIILIPSMWRVV